MIENIVNTGGHLIFRQGVSENRIQNSKFREYVLSEYMTDFQLLYGIRDHCAAVHFRTRADHGQNASDRYDFVIDVFHAKIILFPRIFRTVSGNRNRLCIIANASPAYGKNEIDLVFSCNSASFVKFFNRRIRRDTAVLEYGLSACS